MDYNPLSTKSNISIDSPINILVNDIIPQLDETGPFDQTQVLFNTTETVEADVSTSLSISDVWTTYLSLGLVMGLILELSYINPFSGDTFDVFNDIYLTNDEPFEFYDMVSGFNTLIEFGTPAFVNTNSTFYESFEGLISDFGPINKNQTEYQNMYSGVDTLSIANYTALYSSTDTVSKNFSFDYEVDFTINGTINNNVLDVLLHLNIKLVVDIDYATGIYNSLYFHLHYLDTIDTYSSESIFEIGLDNLDAGVTTSVTTSVPSSSIPSSSVSSSTSSQSSVTTSDIGTTSSPTSSEVTDGAVNSPTTTTDTSTQNTSTTPTSDPPEQLTSSSNSVTTTSSSSLVDASLHNFLYSIVALIALVPIYIRNRKGIQT
jgi:hypothetical protein